VGLLTFGGTPPIVVFDSGGSITLRRDTQSTFTLPFDATIEYIYADIDTWASVALPVGINVYPFVQLFTAPPGSNVFVSIPQAIAIPSTGFSGSVAPNIIKTAYSNQIGVKLTAKTRLLIGGEIQITGSGGLARDYSFSYTGGIAMRSE
jgi:hypothetical protein